MRSSVCSELLHHFDADEALAVDSSPPEFAKWLDTVTLPWDLQHLLRFDWPQKSGYIGHLRIMSAQELLADEFLGSLLRHQLLPIGSAPNGDTLVIRTGSDQCEVGFLTHEEYWEHQEDPLTVYQPIARTLDSLLYRLVEGRYIPTDYYAAKEFNAFLADERRA